MSTRYPSPRLALLFLAALAVATAAPPPAAAQDAAPQTYDFAVVSAPFPLMAWTLAGGLNDQGTVVGTYYDHISLHGYIMDHGTYTSYDVPIPGASDTDLTAINNQGDFVGTYFLNDQSYAFSRIKGRLAPVNYPSNTGGITLLSGINNHGQILGTSSDASGSLGFVYQDGHFLFTFRVPFPGAAGTVAKGLNDYGEIVGSYSTSDGITHGFLRDQFGHFHTIDHPTIPATVTEAMGINDSGQIVGNGFLLDRGKFIPFSDLNSQAATPFESFATGINNRGAILAEIYKNFPETYLLVPIN
jgi:hypothetical protein